MPVPTPHIRANAVDFAKTVLMPGDPLRAKFIAENYLTGAKLVTDVRGMLGYTGTYNGKPVSVMGSGMGMPSIGIYSYELYAFYGVERIIRIGSSGGYSADLALFDVVLATAAYSESTFAKTMSGYTGDTLKPSDELNASLRESAGRLGISMHEGVIHSSDVFYRAEPGRQAAEADKPYWQKLMEEKGCIAVEMESFALFQNASVLGKQAACLVTISDSFVTAAVTSSEQREKGLGRMIEIALGTV